MANAEVFKNLPNSMGRSSVEDGAPMSAAEVRESAGPDAKVLPAKEGYRGKGGYQYAVLDNGDIQITRSTRSRGGQIVKKGSDVHKAIADELAFVLANPEALNTKAEKAAAARAESRFNAPRRKPSEYASKGATTSGAAASAAMPTTASAPKAPPKAARKSAPAMRLAERELSVGDESFEDPSMVEDEAMQSYEWEDPYGESEQEPEIVVPKVTSTRTLPKYLADQLQGVYTPEEKARIQALALVALRRAGLGTDLAMAEIRPAIQKGSWGYLAELGENMDLAHGIVRTRAIRRERRAEAAKTAQ